MPVPGEQDAIGDPEGGEHAPAGEQADLRRSEHIPGGVDDGLVVEDMAVEHQPILAPVVRASILAARVKSSSVMPPASWVQVSTSARPQPKWMSG